MVRKICKIFFCTIAAGIISVTDALCQGYVIDTSSVVKIDSCAIVTAEVRTSGIKGDITRGMDIDMSTLATFPKMLGTADPIKFVQALPGVSTNSDWESGLRVQGCESYQSLTKLCGVPVYGQGHLMGLFSVFNPGHFKNMDFRTTSQSERIGGELNLDTAPSPAERFGLEGNLGPVSTHATFAIPIGKKSTLTLSGRRSFIDIFYKDLIKVEGMSMNYAFFDLNASYLYKINKYNSIDANAYYGVDNGSMAQENASSHIGADWGNALGNIRWRHKKNGLDLSTQLYASSYFMSGDLGVTQTSGRAQDDILNLGLESFAKWHGWDFSARFNYYDIQPQNIVDESSQAPIGTVIPRQKTVLGTVGAAKSFHPGNWTITPALDASIYSDISANLVYPRLDPQVFVEYNMYRGGKLSLTTGLKHQYLFMTGLTNSGFPVEFWLGCGTYSDPQRSLHATLAYSLNFYREMFSLNLQAYGKRLWNVVEYTGYVSELINGNYNLQNMLLHGDGWNYGASVQLQKNSGAVTGWISYSFGRSLRQFSSNPELPGIYPSNHERIHELNAVASYKIKRWEFGGNLILASGVPYTPITSVYYMSETVMVKYGERNSKNLSPYFRLDLSVSFNVHTKGRWQDGFNISVQNATARHNQLMATLKIREGQYCYAPASLIIPVIPSINYYCKF